MALKIIMNKPCPTFIIIGAAKSGTTSLYDYLGQHPQAYVTPTKETNFFALVDRQINYEPGSVRADYISSCIFRHEDYQKQFAQVLDEIAIGESSPIYLYDEDAPKKIYSHLPEVKIIAILRNPVDRAYSNFIHHIREGLETTEDFKEALGLEEYRIKNNWWWGFHYTKASFYYNQLKRYYDIFPKENMKILLYDDLVESPSRLCKNLFHFIGVNPKFSPDFSTHYNSTGVPKNRHLYSFMVSKNPLKEGGKLLFPHKNRKQLFAFVNKRNLTRPSMPTEIREELISIFRYDIKLLEGLIERDLSAWIGK